MTLSEAGKGKLWVVGEFSTGQIKEARPSNNIGQLTCRHPGDCPFVVRVTQQRRVIIHTPSALRSIIGPAFLLNDAREAAAFDDNRNGPNKVININGENQKKGPMELLWCSINMQFIYSGRVSYTYVELYKKLDDGGLSGLSAQS